MTKILLWMVSIGRKEFEFCFINNEMQNKCQSFSFSPPLLSLPTFVNLSHEKNYKVIFGFGFVVNGDGNIANYFIF